MKYKLNLFAISNLSVTITCSSLNMLVKFFHYDSILSRLWFSMFFVNHFTCIELFQEICLFRQTNATFEDIIICR